MPYPSPTRTPTRTPPRTVAGRYVLLDVIGAGGMGTVHRAYDVVRRQHVAAKVLRVDLAAAQAGLLLRFVREQSLRIAHPHVVAPHGWAADDDTVLLVMDLVRGGSLAALARAGPLPERFVAVVVAQLLDALVAVHAAGVVHRDVTPANVLLEATRTGRPHARLGDFGIAALLDDDVRFTRVPGPVGTDGYLAPEAVGGAPPEPRQDLYAVGRLARRILGDAPSRLDPLIDSLLATTPAARPETATVALATLGQLVDLDADWEPSGMPCLVDVLGAAPSTDRLPSLARVSRVCLVGSAALSGAAGLLTCVAAIAP